MPQAGDNWGDVTWCKSRYYFGNEALSLKSSPADNWVMVVTDFDPTTKNPKQKRGNRAKGKQKSRSDRYAAALKLLKKAGAAMKNKESMKKRKSKTNDVRRPARACVVAAAVVSSAAAAAAATTAAAAVTTNDETNPSTSTLALDLIAKHDWVGLHSMAVETYDNLPEAADPLDGWKLQMPIWHSKGCKRSLIGWGQTRKNPNPDPDEEDEPGKIYDKVGAIPELCAKPLFESVDTWLCKFGTPPVIAGTTSNYIYRMYMH